MDGMSIIMQGIRQMMDELFDGVADNDGIYRSFAEHLGVTDAGAVVEVLLEGGLNDEVTYPIIHFFITLASNVPKGIEKELCHSLNVLNNIISVGEFPSFGCFCYYPALDQIFLSYRLPVHPEAPERELDNIRYYLGVLYEELDAFIDYIMYLCDNKGMSPDPDSYVEYLKNISDWDDIAERAKTLSVIFDDMKEQ